MKLRLTRGDYAVDLHDPTATIDDLPRAMTALLRAFPPDGNSSSTDALVERSGPYERPGREDEVIGFRAGRAKS